MTLNDKEVGALLEAVNTMKRDIADLKEEAKTAASFRSKIIGVGVVLVFLQPIITGIIVRQAM